MDYNIKGINEEALDKLIFDILEYIEKLNKEFEKVETLVTQSNDYYKSENATNILTKFKLSQNNFKIMINNLIKYSEDLAKVKENISNFDIDNGITIKNISADITSNFKKGDLSE